MQEYAFRNRPEARTSWHKGYIRVHHFSTDARRQLFDSYAVQVSVYVCECWGGGLEGKAICMATSDTASLILSHAKTSLCRPPASYPTQAMLRAGVHVWDVLGITSVSGHQVTTGGGWDGCECGCECGVGVERARGLDRFSFRHSAMSLCN